MTEWVLVKREKCLVCNGTGVVVPFTRCGHCFSRGYIIGTKQDAGPLIDGYRAAVDALSAIGALENRSIHAQFLTKNINGKEVVMNTATLLHDLGIAP